MSREAPGELLHEPGGRDGYIDHPSRHRASRWSPTRVFLRRFVSSYATRSGSNRAEAAPATGCARNAASLEAMTGQIFLAVVVARLVGLHVTPPPRDTAGLSKT